MFRFQVRFLLYRFFLIFFKLFTFTFYFSLTFDALYIFLFPCVYFLSSFLSYTFSLFDAVYIFPRTLFFFFPLPTQIFPHSYFRFIFFMNSFYFSPFLALVLLPSSRDGHVEAGEQEVDETGKPDK